MAAHLIQESVLSYHGLIEIKRLSRGFELQFPSMCYVVLEAEILDYILLDSFCILSEGEG